MYWKMHRSISCGTNIYLHCSIEIFCLEGKAHRTCMQRGHKSTATPMFILHPSMFESPTNNNLGGQSAYQREKTKSRGCWCGRKPENRIAVGRFFPWKKNGGRRKADATSVRNNWLKRLTETNDLKQNVWLIRVTETTVWVERLLQGTSIGNRGQTSGPRVLRSSGRLDPHIFERASKPRDSWFIYLFVESNFPAFIYTYRMADGDTVRSLSVCIHIRRCGMVFGFLGRYRGVYLFTL